MPMLMATPMLQIDCKGNVDDIKADGESPCRNIGVGGVDVVKVGGKGPHQSVSKGIVNDAKVNIKPLGEMLAKALLITP